MTEEIEMQLSEAAGFASFGKHLQGVWNAKTPRQVLRRLSEILVGSFLIKELDFLRIEFVEGRWTALRKRQVNGPHSSGLQSDSLIALETILSSLDLDQFGDPKESWEGITQFQLGAVLYQVAFFRDRDDELTLILWDGHHLDPTQRTMCDLLVRSVQNEAQWMRRIHSSEQLVYIDDLTGLYNTRYFDQVLTSELRRADRFKTQFTLLFIDLDSFKPINDQFGHLSGSSVLRQVAQVIRDAVREVDVPFRYGGDEFVVILIGAPCSKGAMVAERVRSKICEHRFKLDNHQWTNLTCSIGVASYPEHGKDRQSLIRVADQSMYDSKRLGKNRVTITGKHLERTWNR